ARVSFQLFFQSSLEDVGMHMTSFNQQSANLPADRPIPTIVCALRSQGVIGFLSSGDNSLCFFLCVRCLSKFRRLVVVFPGGGWTFLRRIGRFRRRRYSAFRFPPRLLQTI